MGVARHQQNSPGIYVTQLDMDEGKPWLNEHLMPQQGLPAYD
jgi:hypothetical protein